MNGANDKQNEEDQTIRMADLYEKMSKVLRENLERAGMLTEEAFEKALNDSRAWALKFKESHQEEIGRVAEFIRRDWQEDVRAAGQQARKTLDPDRLHAGLLGLLLQLVHSMGDRLEQWAGRLRERLTYRTGEIAGAGTLACNGCGEQLRFDKPAPIPPCPNCGGNSFTRSY